MTKVVFPGSFDPPTNGHVYIIEKASRLFDEVDVVFAVNQGKKYLFSIEERVALMRQIAQPFKNVTVNVCTGLIANYIEESGAKFMLRGLRTASDCEFEFELAFMNRVVNKNAETIFMPTDPKNSVIRSSSIKELAKAHCDVSDLVPEIVNDALKKKFA